MNAETTYRPPQTTEVTLVAFMAELKELEQPERNAALLDWVRSDWWSPVLMLCEGDQGKIAKEAYRALKHELDAESPGKQWHKADTADGRQTIIRLLGVEGHKAACYAAAPFRMMWTQEDEPWIGAAVGSPPLLDAQRLMQWQHIDIRHVILWNPKNGRTRLLGDDEHNQLILPEPAPDVLDVYSDTQAFFSAWARRRSSFAAMFKLHGLGEDADGHLPGALVVGRLEKVSWPLHAAASLVPRASVSPRMLRDAVLRSAHLPKVVEDAVAHG